MQVADGQPPPRIGVRRRLHPVRRIEVREHQLAHIRSRRRERPRAQPLRQVRIKAVHDLEDLLHAAQVMRHLHRHRPRTRDRLHEKPRRDPGRQPHLPRLQHHVPLPRPPLELPLRPVRHQRHQRPVPVAHLQPRRRHRLHQRRPPALPRKPRPQPLPQLAQHPYLLLYFPHTPASRFHPPRSAGAPAGCFADGPIRDDLPRSGKSLSRRYRLEGPRFVLASRSSDAFPSPHRPALPSKSSLSSLDASRDQLSRATENRSHPLSS